MLEISSTYKALDNINVLYAVHYAEFNGTCRTLKLKGPSFSLRDDRELRKYLNKLGAFENGYRYKLSVSDESLPRAKVQTMSFASIYALLNWLVECVHTTNRVAPFSTVLSTQELFSRGMETLVRTTQGRKENSQQHVFTGLPELGYLHSMALLMSEHRFSAEVLGAKWYDIVPSQKLPGTRVSKDSEQCVNKVLPTYKKVRGYNVSGALRGVNVQFKIEKVEESTVVQPLNPTESTHAFLALMRVMHRIFDKLMLCGGQSSDFRVMKALLTAYVYVNTQLLPLKSKKARSIVNDVNDLPTLILRSRQLSAVVSGAEAKPATEPVRKVEIVPADNPKAPNSFDPPAYASNANREVATTGPEVSVDLLLEMRNMKGLKEKGLAAISDVKDPAARMLFKYLVETYFKSDNKAI